MRPATPQQILRFFFRVEGRIGRAEYGLGLGFLYAIDMAIFIYALGHPDMDEGTLLVLIFLSLPLAVAIAVIIAKRCHDLGLPGSFFLLLLVPLVGIVWLFALAFLPGNPGPNRYGAAPAFEPE